LIEAKVECYVVTVSMWKCVEISIQLEVVSQLKIPFIPIVCKIVNTTKKWDLKNRNNI